MKLISTRLICILSMSMFFSGIAVAEPYPDGKGVSKMNNQLVEVGDRNRYHYDYPRYNVSVNPFGVLFGSYSLAGSMAFHENFAARGEVTVTESEGDRGVGLETSLTAPIYFKKMYSGIYLEPGFLYRNKEYAGTNNSIYGPQVLLGYTMFWDSGLNVSLAAGMGRNWNDSKDAASSYSEDEDDEVGAPSSEVFGNAYLKVGYAF